MRQRRITYPPISTTLSGDSTGVTATHQRRDGNPFLGQESMHYCASCRNDGHPSRRLPARSEPFADRYAMSTWSGCMSAPPRESLHPRADVGGATLSVLVHLARPG